MHHFLPDMIRLGDFIKSRGQRKQNNCKKQVPIPVNKLNSINLNDRFNDEPKVKITFDAAFLCFALSHLNLLHPKWFCLYFAFLHLPSLNYMLK